jgi:antitoxin MazE
MTAKTRIVRIGKSCGIRVPKVLLDEAGLPEEVELRAEPGRLVVSAATRPRAGWATKAGSMHQRAHDKLLDPTRQLSSTGLTGAGE